MRKILAIGIISLIIIPSTLVNLEINTNYQLGDLSLKKFLEIPSITKIWNKKDTADHHYPSKVIQPIDDLNDVAVWTFNSGIYTEERVDSAVYVNPQYCKRAWFKYDTISYDYFPDPRYNLWEIPPLLNDGGALFEGGVQVACLDPEAGWPCDNEHDEDHEPPYKIPECIFDDFVTKNSDDDIYWVSNIYEHQVCHASIANENYRDFVLYWAYEQIDAGVNALEFDEINGAYGLTQYGVPGDNLNEGYDDYAIGAANFANKLSVVCGHGMVDPIKWFMPKANASSEVDSAKYAFDDDPTTFWESCTGNNHWIEIDLGRTRTVQQIYLCFHPGHILNNFQIEYWNNSSWTEFTPSISATDNTLLNRSFLVEPVSTDKIRLFSSDSVVYIPELKILGQGFRQFLMKKYCVDLGWTVNDSRWETEKFVDFADSNQCPDGTMNTFNYREYLKYHNWTGDPFGGPIDITNYLEPLNPLFLDWFPGKYCKALVTYFISDGELVNDIMELYLKSYSYQRLFSTFWKSICDSVREYAEQKGMKVYITNNGSVSLPHYVDYMLAPMGDGGLFPAYPAPSSEDPNGTYLDGRQAQINLWRMLKERGVNFLGREAPVVAFLDFGHHGTPFSHLGGLGEPADERIEYLKIYSMEMYAAGVNFCFPVIEPGENAWMDSASDGTLMIEVIKQLTGFLNGHKDVYGDVTWNNFENEVKVNGVTPFNGEWNVVNGRIYSPVNESKVTISYMDSRDYTKSYLHIINHNWNDASRKMIPQSDVPVEIPVKDGCLNMKIISPDFTGEISLDFQYENGTVKTIIPNLAYYDVIEISYGMHVDIEKPNDGYLYVFNKEIMPLPKNTIIIGELTVEANAYSEHGIDRVEFYIDDELKHEDDEFPYEWLWDERTFGRHEIKVIAYDKEGNTTSDSQEVWIFNI